MEQYLLQCPKGYYWIWFKTSDMPKPRLNGPHSDKILNLPVIQVENPVAFNPKDDPNPSVTQT